MNDTLAAALDVPQQGWGRFYVQSQAQGDLNLFATAEEAMEDAKAKRAAPFTLFELLPHPRALVHSNGPNEILEKTKAT